MHIFAFLFVIFCLRSQTLFAQTTFDKKYAKPFAKPIFDSSGHFFKTEGFVNNCITRVDGWFTCVNPDDIIHCIGNVGIGPFVCQPRQKLEIAHNDPRGGIVLNRVNDPDFPKTNEIYFEHNGYEQWAIGNDFKMQGGDIGHNFFVWDNLKLITRMYVNLNGIGINDNLLPACEFDVKGSIRSSALGNGSGKIVQTDGNGILINTAITSLQSNLNYWHSNGTDVYRTSAEGKVFIGMNPCTTACGSSLYKLYVDGGIVTRDVKVTINPFPDFVFDKKYQLRSLSDLEEYITANKHLPNIPSGFDVAKNDGFEIGAMQTKLLQTVEEQALYIIDLQKQMNELKIQLDALKR